MGDNSLISERLVLLEKDCRLENDYDNVAVSADENMKKAEAVLPALPPKLQNSRYHTRSSSRSTRPNYSNIHRGTTSKTKLIDLTTEKPTITHTDSSDRGAVFTERQNSDENNTLDSDSQADNVVTPERNGGLWSTVKNKKPKKSYSTVVGSKTGNTGQCNQVTTGEKPAVYLHDSKHDVNLVNKKKRVITVGCGQNTMLTGVKRAWFHLGKVKKGTSKDSVDLFLKETFPDTDFEVEKLVTKGTTDSFRLGVDFSMKDKVIDNSLWPKNIVLKRFLFRRPNHNPLR